MKTKQMGETLMLQIKFLFYLTNPTFTIILKSDTEVDMKYRISSGFESH